MDDSVRPAGFSSATGKLKITAPVDLIGHAAGGRFIGFRWNGETPDRAPSPNGLTAPMALRPEYSEAMAAQRKTYGFCIRCFRQCGLENVRK